jgi:hypothetical protein
MTLYLQIVNTIKNLINQIGRPIAQIYDEETLKVTDELV